MTCIKKSDWLRHLYIEATKWKYSITGKVKWIKLNLKNPQKMTIPDLENGLLKILQDCLNNNKVLLEYQPEVNHFMSTVSVSKQFDNKFVANLVCIRKLAIGLGSFSKLSPDDKRKVRSNVMNEDLQSVVCELQTKLNDMGLEEGQGRVEADEPEPSSKFNRFDWLKHIYVECQKWLQHKPEGRLQWKKLEAQDPNNSKDGKRMKMEEVQQSLQIWVRSLDDSIVPRAYQCEVDLIRKILCRGEGHFCNDVLEHEEKLRDVSVKLVEILPTLKDKMQQVVSAIEERKPSWVGTVTDCLQELTLPDLPYVDPEDANELEILFESMGDVGLLSELYDTVLPQSDVSSLENQGSPNRKRKSPRESTEEKATKKAKP